MKVCSISWCDSNHEAHDYCKRHYKSLIKYGNPLQVDINQAIKRIETEKKPEPRPMLSREGVCSADGCEGPIKAKRLCEKHYARLRRYKELKPIPNPKCSIEKKVDEYREWMQENHNHKRGTLRAKMSLARMFLRFIENQGIRIESINQGNIAAWIDSRNGTVIRSLREFSAIRNFILFLGTTVKLEHDFSDLKFVDIAFKKDVTVSKGELQKLIDAGMSNREIANHLGLATRSAASHLKAYYGLSEKKKPLDSYPIIRERVNKDERLTLEGASPTFLINQKRIKVFYSKKMSNRCFYYTLAESKDSQRNETENVMRLENGKWKRRFYKSYDFFLFIGENEDKNFIWIIPVLDLDIKMQTISLRPDSAISKFNCYLENWEQLY